MKKEYYIQMVCIALMLMLAMPTFAQKKSSKSKKANPYATVPASLITDKGKLDMLHSIQDLGDGRFFYLDYTENYKLDELIGKNITSNEGLKGFSVSKKKAIISVNCDYSKKFFFSFDKGVSVK